MLCAYKLTKYLQHHVSWCVLNENTALIHTTKTVNNQKINLTHYLHLKRHKVNLLFRQP